MIRKQLYTLVYQPGKEKASEFCNRFEALVNTFESLPNTTSLPEEERRDAFYNTISKSVQSVKQVDFLTRTERGTRLSYDQLRDFILHDEDDKQTGKEHASTTALAVGRGRFKITCRNCMGLGHIKRDCPNAGKIRCRNCKQLGDHMARDCANPAVTSEISTQESNRGGHGRLQGGFGCGRFTEGSRKSENKRFKHNPLY